MLKNSSKLISIYILTSLFIGSQLQLVAQSQLDSSEMLLINKVWTIKEMYVDSVNVSNKDLKIKFYSNGLVEAYTNIDTIYIGNFIYDITNDEIRLYKNEVLKNRFKVQYIDHSNLVMTSVENIMPNNIIIKVEYRMVPLN